MIDDPDPPFDRLSLHSRVEVIYEREVHVEVLTHSIKWPETFTHVALGRHLSDVSAALPGWYAIVDAEGDLVCLVPPGEGNDAVQRAMVVAEMLNRRTD